MNMSTEEWGLVWLPKMYSSPCVQSKWFAVNQAEHAWANKEGQHTDALKPRKFSMPCPLTFPSETCPAMHLIRPQTEPVLTIQQDLLALQMNLCLAFCHVMHDLTST